MHLCRSFSKAPRLPTFLKLLQSLHVLLTFGRVQNPLHLPHRATLQRPKVARTWCVLYMLTSTCAWRHNGVHFFDSSTSRFLHVDFEMCFAPQRLALFRRLNFQKRSDTEVFCTFVQHLIFLSAPTLVCFSRFYFEVCFAPQWRAIFHLSSDQKSPHTPL